MNNQPASSNASRAQVFDVVCAEIKKLAPESGTLADDTDMTKDLSLDSVAVMDLMFELEEKFDIAVSMNDLADVYTIGGLVDLICAIKDRK